MTSKNFTEMTDSEFDTLINGYIDREATRYGEMPADIFFDLLLERITAKANQTLNLLVNIVDNHLVITPDRENAQIVIKGNEIMVGTHRLVFKLGE